MKLRAKKQLTNFCFMVPALILFCFIVVYPFIKGVRISLTDWDGFSPSYKFVGIQNFVRILKDPSIKGPIINSLFFTIVTVIIDNVIGLGVAFAFTVNVTLFLGWGLKVFDYVMAATNGGPGRASETFAMYVYNYTFPYNRAGYGQAAAILMMIFIFIISGVVSTLLRRREIDM